MIHKRKRTKQADADSLGIRLEDLIGPPKKQTREQLLAQLAKPHAGLEMMTKRVMSTLTPREREVLRDRVLARTDEIVGLVMQGLRRRNILVWCHSCGCSFDWPWGRCIYRCERCGSGRMSALDPGGQRGELAS